MSDESTLGYAAFMGDLGRVRALLAAGADPDEAWGTGTPLLEVMDEPGEFFDDTALEIAVALLDAGASVNAADDRGERPLHVAARDGHRGLALLLERGADVDARTSRGWTPLHCAVDYENDAGVAQLLAAGADRNVTDAYGQTPLDLARMAHSRAPSPELQQIISLLDA